MDVFQLRAHVVDPHGDCIGGVVTIRDECIREKIEAELASGLLSHTVWRHYPATSP